MKAGEVSGCEVRSVWSRLRSIWWQVFRRKAIVAALALGDVPKVESLLKMGINPNLVVSGSSLLTHAVKGEKCDQVVHKLVQYGATFLGRGNEDFLPTAVTKRNRELVSLACGLGLDINQHGQAILERALRWQDPELIDLIMELGVDPKPLHYYRWHVVNGAVIRRLMAWGMDVPDDIRRCVEQGRWDPPRTGTDRV